MLHRTAVTNWITAAARVQQLLARKTAELGSALTRRVAAGEVVAVSTGDVEKIGWFVEALSRFTAAAARPSSLVCVGLVVYQPALGVRGRRRRAGARARGAAAAAPRRPGAPTSSGRRPAGPPSWPPTPSPVCGCCAASAARSSSSTATAAASQEVRQAAVRSARMWSLISAIQVLLPGLLLIAVVWYGVHAGPRRPDHGRRTGHRVQRGHAPAVSRCGTSRRSPWRTPSPGRRPSGPRGCCPWSGPRTRAARATAARRRRPAICTTRPPGCWRPPGSFTAVVCGDPDAAGRLADRLGGHSPTGRGGEARRCCSAGCALDELPLDSARDRRPRPGQGPGAALRHAARAARRARLGRGRRRRRRWPPPSAADVLDALRRRRRSDARATRWTPGSPSAAGPCPAGSASGSRWPARWSPTRRCWCWTSRRRAVDSHTEARIADGLRRAARPAAPRWCSPPRPLLLDRADRVVFVHEGTVAAVGAHRDLLRDEPRYRAVVTRETEDERGRRPQLDDRGRDRAPTSRDRALEEIEEIGMIGVAPPAYDPAAPTTASTLPVGTPATVRAYVTRAVPPAPPRLRCCWSPSTRSRWSPRWSGPYLLGDVVEELSDGRTRPPSGAHRRRCSPSRWSCRPCSSGRCGCAARCSASEMLADLREDFLVRSVGLPPGVLERAGTGDLLSRITTDIDRLANAMREAVPQLAIGVVWAALLLGALTVTAPPLALAVLVALPLLVVGCRWYFRRAPSGLPLGGRRVRGGRRRARRDRGRRPDRRGAPARRPPDRAVGPADQGVDGLGAVHAVAAVGALPGHQRHPRDDPRLGADDRRGLRAPGLDRRSAS